MPASVFLCQFVCLTVSIYPSLILCLSVSASLPLFLSLAVAPPCHSFPLSLFPVSLFLSPSLSISLSLLSPSLFSLSLPLFPFALFISPSPALFSPSLFLLSLSLFLPLSLYLSPPPSPPVQRKHSIDFKWSLSHHDLITKFSFLDESQCW